LIFNIGLQKTSFYLWTQTGKTKLSLTKELAIVVGFANKATTTKTRSI
jgi:hypothetical protein